MVSIKRIDTEKTNQQVSNSNNNVSISGKLESAVPQLISNTLDYSTLIYLLHVVYNLGNRNQIISLSNSFLANYHKDKDNIVEFKFPIDFPTNNEIVYQEIMWRLYKNISYELKMLVSNTQLNNSIKENSASKFGNQYVLHYLPLSASALSNFIRNLSKNIEAEDKIEIILEHYRYLEVNIISTLENLGVQLFTAVSPSGEIIKQDAVEDLRHRLSRIKTEPDFVRFLPEFLNDGDYRNNIFDNFQEQYSYEEITFLFNISLVTLNSYLLNELLKVDDHFIYAHIQQINPLILIDSLTLQMYVMSAYIGFNQANLDTRIYDVSTALSVKDLIVDYFDKLNMYPNFIKVINYQLERADKMLSSASNLNLSNEARQALKQNLPIVTKRFSEHLEIDMIEL